MFSRCACGARAVTPGRQLLLIFSIQKNRSGSAPRSSDPIVQENVGTSAHGSWPLPGHSVPTWTSPGRLPLRRAGSSSRPGVSASACSTTTQWRAMQAASTLREWACYARARTVPEPANVGAAPATSGDDRLTCPCSTPGPSLALRRLHRGLHRPASCSSSKRCGPSGSNNTGPFCLPRRQLDHHLAQLHGQRTSGP